jgi:UDP-N-acetylglucosamine acyltransferase
MGESAVDAPPPVHATAVVDPGAVLGAGVRVGPYAVIGPKVTLGEGCEVGPHAVLDGRTTFGPRNRVFSHAAIGGIPQDLKYRGEDTALEIGEGNTFREFVTVHIGTAGGGGVTRIGSGGLFMAYVHVAHDCIIGDGVILANGVTLGGHVEIHDRAVVGGLSAIHQFVRVGELAMVGGCSAVDQDVPPYCLALGNRVTLRGLNLTGLKRAGVERDELRTLKAAYALLFEGDLPLKDAAKEALDRWPEEPRVRRLAEFCLAGERGVCR